MSRKTTRLRGVTAGFVTCACIWAMLPATASAQTAAECEGEPATITGTEGPDTIEGTPGDDVVAGLGGDDTIRGLKGSDLLCGGPGNDTIDADGSKPERPVREAFSDVLDGGAGDDHLTGAPLTVALYGGPGDDVLVGARVSYARAEQGVVANVATGDAFGEGADTLVGVVDLVGSSFDDRLFGDERRNDLSGGLGDDELWGAGETDELLGGDGDDLVLGEGGNDFFLYGGAGSDFVSGGEGFDVLYPEIISVRSASEFGDDFVDGGDGHDKVSFVAVIGSVTVDLGSHHATGQGEDEIWDVEEVEGTYGNDVIEGDEWDNRLWGSGGGDVVIGGAGDDFLGPALLAHGTASEGDALRGGRGDDTLQSTACCSDETVRGGPGRDTGDFFWAGGNNNPVFVDLEAGTFEIGFWSGTLDSIENVKGTALRDRIAGDSRRNVLDGGSGEDRIRGRGGRDRLVGGPDVDELHGGSGVDACRDRRDVRRSCELQP